MEILKIVDFSGSFLVGAFIGSYIITITSRIRNKEKIRGGYSHCMYCKGRLKVKHILPIASYLYYKGKCPFCRKAIGLSTLLWEVGIGLLAIIPAFFIGANESLYYLIGIMGIAVILQSIMGVDKGVRKNGTT